MSDSNNSSKIKSLKNFSEWSGVRYDEATQRGMLIAGALLFVCWLLNIYDIKWVSIVAGIIFMLFTVIKIFDPKIIGSLAAIGILSGIKNKPTTIEESTGSNVSTYTKKLTLANAVFFTSFAILGVIPFSWFPMGFWLYFFGFLFLVSVYWQTMGELAEKYCIRTGYFLIFFGLGFTLINSPLLPGLDINIYPTSWNLRIANIESQKSYAKKMEADRIKDIEAMVKKLNTNKELQKKDLTSYNNTMREIGSRKRIKRLSNGKYYFYKVDFDLGKFFRSINL